MDFGFRCELNTLEKLTNGLQLLSGAVSQPSESCCSWTLIESKPVKALNGFILRLLHIPVEVLNDLEYPVQGQALLGYQFETFPEAAIIA
jgi:hypothetical protein